MKKQGFILVAIILGIAGALLSVLSVIAYLNYFPPEFVYNLTYGELGGLAALAVVGAVGMGAAADSVPG